MSQNEHHLPVKDAWRIVMEVPQARVCRVAPPPEILLLEEAPLEYVGLVAAIVLVGDLVVGALRRRGRREETAARDALGDINIWRPHLGAMYK